MAVMVEVEVEVSVVVSVEVAVGVVVGVEVEVELSVEVAVSVKVGVSVKVLVAVEVEVAVPVRVAVVVWVSVGVAVPVEVEVVVPVGVEVGVAVSVEVAVVVEVGVAAETVWVFPLTEPVTMAPWPVPAPEACTSAAAVWLLKVLFVMPPTFRSNTRITLTGVPGATLTNPPSFVKVTFPKPSKLWLPRSKVSVPESYKPFPFTSWYNLTLPATVSEAQRMFTPPALPVKDISFTSTFSCAEAARTTWTLDTFCWLKP